MFIIPGKTIRLWVIYQENGSTITGVTDLKVIGKDQTGSTILTETALSEDGSTGFYYYDWNTSSVGLEKTITVYYKKDTETLFSENYEFDIIEDTDGIIL